MKDSLLQKVIAPFLTRMRYNETSSHSFELWVIAPFLTRMRYNIVRLWYISIFVIAPFLTRMRYNQQPKRFLHY